MLIMIMFLNPRTKALNKLCASLVVSLRSKMSGTDCPIVSANIHWICGECPAQAVLPNPMLCRRTFCKHARRKLRLRSDEYPNDAHSALSCLTVNVLHHARSISFHVATLFGVQVAVQPISVFKIDPEPIPTKAAGNPANQLAGGCWLNQNQVAADVSRRKLNHAEIKWRELTFAATGLLNQL